MIFSVLNPEKIWHQQFVHLLTSPVYCSHFTLGNPKKSFFNRLFTLSQKKTNCYPLTHHTWKMSPHGTGTFRAQDLSFPRTNSPYGNFRSRDFSFPGNESSWELSFPGPFVPRNFRSQDFSFPGTFVPPTILQGIGYERRQL